MEMQGQQNKGFPLFAIEKPHCPTLALSMGTPYLWRHKYIAVWTAIPSRGRQGSLLWCLQGRPSDKLPPTNVVSHY